MSDAHEPESSSKEPLEEVSLSSSVYLRLRGLPVQRRRRKRRVIDADDKDAPFMPGRDPKGLGFVLQAVTRADIDQGDVGGEGGVAHDVIR